MTRPSAVCGLLVAVLLSACSSSDQSPAQSEPGATVQRAADSAPASSARGANACLLAYAERYDELLPLSVAADAAQRPADAATTEYAKAVSNVAYQNVQYAWDGQRVRVVKAGAAEIRVPRPDTLALGGMEAMTVESFRRSYRAVTAAELQRLDAEVAASKNEALQSDQAKQVAGSLTRFAANLTSGFRDVDGLGDAAVFNTNDSKLHVIDRGVKFTVTADLGEDQDANQAVAVAVARRALAQCP